jgi:hypothetical protein
MAFLASVVITSRARVLLDDTDSVYWDDDLVLLRWLTDAVRIVRDLRPEEFLTTDGDTLESDFDDIPDYTLVADIVPLRQRWVPALVDYVLSRAYDDEAGEKYDKARSKAHFDKFTAFLRL